MNFLDDIIGKVFPTRMGGAIGASEENRMIKAVGGEDGIRTKIQINPDGSTTMLRTRGGAPEFTTTKPRPKPVETPPEPKPDRTFLFRVFEQTAPGVVKTAVLANRKGSGMRVVSATVESGYDSCYNVAPTISASGLYKTLNNTTWRDVWRIFNKKILINGHPAVTVQETTTARYGPNHIPYIHQFGGSYISANPNAPLQSLVYVGGNTEVFTGVCAIKKDGTETVKVTPHAYGTAYAPLTGMIAGLSVDSAGVYRFFGNDLQFFTYDNQYRVLYLSWSKITTSIAAPYVTETTYGEELFGPQGRLFGITPDINAAITVSSYTVPDPPLGSAGGTLTDTSLMKMISCHYTQSELNVPYAFIGSDIEMRLSKTIDHHYDNRYGAARKSLTFDTLTFNVGQQACFAGTSTVGIGDPWDYGGGDYGASRNTVSTVALDAAGLKRLFELTTSSVGGSRVLGYWAKIFNKVKDATPCGFEYPSEDVFVSDPFGTDATTGGVSVVIKTRDYVYADMQEEVFITFETQISCSRNNDLAALNKGVITAKYVLSIRGVDHEFVVTVGEIPAEILGPLNAVYSPYWMPPFRIAQTSSGYGQAYGNEGGGGFYFPGYKPPPIFNPLFMHQGNCPNIAYTTKAEEAAGATPEFYLDLELVPRPYIFTVGGLEGPNFSDKYTFTPAQFHKAYYKAVMHETTYEGGQGADISSPGSARNGAYVDNGELPWERHLFPDPGSGVTRLQFCNGVIGPWGSKIGNYFPDPAQRIDISRI